MTEPLLPRVASGDPAAVREVLDRYGGLLWSLARRFLNDPTDAEDAVQEIVIELWRHAERFDPSLASETTFVAMVARRRLIDRVRGKMRQPPSEPMFEEDLRAGEVPPDRLEVADEVARVTAALATLPEAQQRSVRLAVFDGLTHQRISEMLELPLGTVKSHIRRGLIGLREKLGVTTDEEASP
ncbi:MAG: sigma-70 family RNA polymerase sigma factor [Planctomycetes bacterium]|nr:sigma-70 family RNA polymerase sigma factor [Planctomycetota bacterium]